VTLLQYGGVAITADSQAKNACRQAEIPLSALFKIPGTTSAFYRLYLCIYGARWACLIPVSVRPESPRSRFASDGSGNAESGRTFALRACTGRHVIAPDQPFKPDLHRAAEFVYWNCRHQLVGSTPGPESSLYQRSDLTKS
jgi:hypothetical protein